MGPAGESGRRAIEVAKLLGCEHRRVVVVKSHSILVLHRLASLRLKERRREDTEHKLKTRKKHRGEFNVNEW